MLRTILALAFAVRVLSPADADACSCAKISFAEHAKSEKRVFLARAHKPIQTGDALKQTFTVLATFKGPVTAQFQLDRGATPPCASSYADGEVAILFTTAGDLDPCHGNVPLGALASDLPAILAATSTKHGAAKADAVEAALRHVLPKYLHARPQISIRHTPLAGASFTIDKSRLTFAKAAAPKDIEIKTAIATDSVAVVEGRYDTEGLRFAVVLHFDKTWKAVGGSATER